MRIFRNIALLLGLIIGFLVPSAFGQQLHTSYISNSFETGFDWETFANCNFSWVRSDSNASQGAYSMKFNGSEAPQGCITYGFSDSVIISGISPQDSLTMTFDFFRSSGLSNNNDLFLPGIYFTDGSQGLHAISRAEFSRNYNKSPSESQPGWYGYEIETTGQHILDSIPGQSDTLVFAFIGLSGGNGENLYVDSVNVNYKRKSLDPVNLSEPNGGETLTQNSNFSIQWSAQPSVSTVNLEYSSDAGNTWNTIASRLNAGLGSYQWNVPNVNSNNCLLRIVDANDPTQADTSDNAFSIFPAPPEINVTSPTFSENLYIARERKIKWTNKNTDSVDIEYSIDDGLSWKTITTNFDASKGEYDWVVPNDPNTSTRAAEVRVISSKYPSYGDTVTQMDIVHEFGTSRLTLLKPQKGDTVKAKSVYDLEWVANDNVEDLSLAITFDGNFLNRTYFANGVPPNQSIYSWNVPLEQTQKAQIFVFSQGDGLIDSTGEFHIQLPDETIEIARPNGGEIVENNTNQTIHWVNSSDVQNVDLAYSIDRGASWSNINSNVPANQDSISWEVPQVNSKDCLVRAQASNDPSIKNISDSTFSIVDPIPRVTLTPNPNLYSLTIATKVDIVWESENIDEVDIEYSTNEGVNWAPIVQNHDAESGLYQWTVPNTPTSGFSGLIRIYKSDNMKFGDTSRRFEIVTGQYPALSLQSPSKNDTLFANRETEIKWIVNDLVENLDIEFSRDGGNSWSTIASEIDASNNSYQWTTPQNPANNAELRIVDADNTSIIDHSGKFVIEKEGTGVSTYDKNTKLNLFPNPAKNQVNIKLPGSLNKGNLKVTIVSGDGRVQTVSDFKTGDQIDIDVSHLPSGIYYVKIQGNSRQYFGKFAKQ